MIKLIKNYFIRRKIIKLIKQVEADRKEYFRTCREIDASLTRAEDNCKAREYLKQKGEL